MKIVVGFFEKTEVKLVLLLIFIVAMALASFGDIYVIIVDLIEWFRKW